MKDKHFKKFYRPEFIEGDFVPNEKANLIAQIIVGVLLVVGTIFVIITI